jgi:hypothetical protein
VAPIDSKASTKNGIERIKSGVASELDPAFAKIYILRRIEVNYSIILNSEKSYVRVKDITSLGN